jgi:hypothetical protein
MGKLLLLSILVGPIVLAARAANVKNSRTGLRKAIVQIAIFDAVYLFFLLFVYGRLL